MKRQSEDFKQRRKAFPWKEKEKLVEGPSRSGGTCQKWSPVSEGRAGKGQQRERKIERKITRDLEYTGGVGPHWGCTGKQG